MKKCEGGEGGRRCEDISTLGLRSQPFNHNKVQINYITTLRTPDDTNG